jgi:hypothetical protein
MPVTTFEDDSDCYQNAGNVVKSIYYFLKEALAFEINQEMDAILLIIGIVCRIVIKSVQQCTYFLFSVNLLLVGFNYRQRTMQVCS